MRIVALLAMIALTGLFGASPGQAETRVALVIGNSAYHNSPALPNPRNDAADIGASLERLGFTVSRTSDATYETMRRALRDFASAARRADMAVVFFAGHGLEIGGENWLLPVDAEMQTDVAAEHEAIGLRSILPIVGSASKLGLVILDACRNNPFANTMQRSLRTRAVERGFARVEPTGTVLVAYAAKEGTTANDGDGRNSPFTAALLANLETPGLEINYLFRHVREAVIRATPSRQEPVVYGALPSTQIFLKAPVVAAPPDPAAQAWAFVEASASPAVLEDYLRRFGTSPFAARVRARLEELTRGQVAALPPALSPPTSTRTERIDRTYGPGWFDAVVALPDGGFVVAGREVEMLEQNKANSVIALVMRLDRKGEPVWRRTFGSETSHRTADSIRLLPNEHVLVTGVFNISGPEWAAQIDANGRTVWEKEFGTSRKEFYRSVIARADGSFAVVGDQSLTTGRADARIFILGDDGTSKAEIKLVESFLDCSPTAVGLPDSGFAVAWGAAKDGKEAGARLQRLDKNGLVVFDRAVGQYQDACPRSVVTMDDGGYLVVGNLSSQKERSLWLARLDAAGALSWEQRYGPATDIFGYAAAAAGRPGGPIVLTGCVEIKRTTTSSSNMQALTIGTDGAGRQLWEKEGNRERGGMGRAVALLPDGGAVVAGSHDLRCVEFDGFINGGVAWLFTVPPDDMAPTAAGGR